MKIVLAGTLAAALAVAGCNATDTATVVQQAGSVAAAVSVVQQQAKAVCQFRPDFKTVVEIAKAGASLFGKTIPAVDAVSTMADAICTAMAPMASGPGSSKTPGFVLGVRVRGHFVK